MEANVKIERRNTCNAFVAKIGEQNNGAQHQDLQITRQLGLEEEKKPVSKS